MDLFHIQPERWVTDLESTADRGETQASPAIQVTRGGFNAAESEDGKYIYFAKGRGIPGLWRRGLNSTSEGEEPVLQPFAMVGLGGFGNRRHFLS